MIQSFVNNLFENNQSSISSDTTDLIIYSELSSCILKYLEINVVQKYQYFLSYFQIFDESYEASTS